MAKQDSPIRLLTKTYASNLITREHYQEIMAKLLRKLEHSGSIELKDFYDQVKNSNAFLTDDDEPGPETRNAYTASDWIIFLLGLIASIVLAYILYI